MNDNHCIWVTLISLSLSPGPHVICNMGWTPDTHRGSVLCFCGSVLVTGTALVSLLLAIRRKGWTRPWRLRTPEGAKPWTFSSNSQTSVSRLRVDTRRHCMVCSIRTRQKGNKVAHEIASWRERGANRVERVLEVRVRPAKEGKVFLGEEYAWKSHSLALHPGIRL